MTGSRKKRSLGRRGRRHGVLVLVRRGLGLAGVWKEGGLGRRLEIVRQNGNVHVQERDILRRSMSAGVTYWVPEIHWMLLIVGRGGMRSWGLSSMSVVRTLGMLVRGILTVVMVDLRL
jgi:hypothetical protein